MIGYTKGTKGSGGRLRSRPIVQRKLIVFYLATAPNGSRVKKRFPTAAPNFARGVAALKPPGNGKPWRLVEVAETEQGLPDHILDDRKSFSIVECHRKSSRG